MWPWPFLYDLWAFSPHPQGEARPLGKWLPCPSAYTLLYRFVPRHSWAVVVWAYFWPSYVLPPHCCRWVSPVWPTLYPDQRLSLGISVSGKISLNPPGSCQWTKDHVMHTYSIPLPISVLIAFIVCFYYSHTPLHALGELRLRFTHFQVPDGCRYWMHKWLSLRLWEPSCFSIVKWLPTGFEKWRRGS